MNIKAQIVDVTAPSRAGAPAPYDKPLGDVVMAAFPARRPDFTPCDFRPGASPPECYPERERNRDARGISAFPVTLTGYDPYWGPKPGRAVPAGESQHLRGVRVTVDSWQDALELVKLHRDRGALYEFLSLTEGIQTTLIEYGKLRKKSKDGKLSAKDTDSFKNSISSYKRALRHCLRRQDNRAVDPDTNQPIRLIDRPIFSRFLNGRGICPDNLQHRSKEPWVAVEIECCLPMNHIEIMEELKKRLIWGVGIKTDGSLRATRSSDVCHELVFCRPRKGFEDCLAKLCKFLKDMDAVVNNTCGLHMHLDMRGKKEKEVESLAMDLESHMPFVANMVAPHRTVDNNHARFCLPGLSWENRYHRVNLAAFRRHYTLEIRLHQGEVDYLPIINWVHLMESLLGHRPISQKMKQWIAKLKVPVEERRYWTERVNMFWPLMIAKDATKIAVADIDRETINLRPYMMMAVTEPAPGRNHYPYQHVCNGIRHCFRDMRQCANHCINSYQTHMTLNAALRGAGVTLNQGEIRAWAGAYPDAGPVELHYNGVTFTAANTREAIQYILRTARSNRERNLLMDEAHIPSMTIADERVWQRRLASVEAGEGATPEPFVHRVAPHPPPIRFEPAMQTDQVSNAYYTTAYDEMVRSFQAGIQVAVPLPPSDPPRVMTPQEPAEAVNSNQRVQWIQPGRPLGFVEPAADAPIEWEHVFDEPTPAHTDL